MLHQAGVKLYYLPGNHDLRIGDFFIKELGMELLPPLAQVSFQGRRTLLAHGDLLDRTLGSRFTHQMLQSSVNQWLFSLLDPRLGMRLAQSVCGLSRRLSRNHSKELLEFARKELDLGYEMVIMAHIHSPVLCRIGQGYYMNLGDWVEHQSYGVIEEGIPRLEFFSP
jgi:UDP-2,3-diacylglucosamine hydrolase